MVEADIPEGILPHGLTGQLYDVKVFTKRGPDDAIYDSCEDIRQKVIYLNILPFYTVFASSCYNLSAI